MRDLTPTQAAVSSILDKTESLRDPDPHLLNIYVHLGEDERIHTSLIDALNMAADVYQGTYFSLSPENQDEDFDDVWMTREKFLEYILSDDFDVRTH